MTIQKLPIVLPVIASLGLSGCAVLLVGAGAAGGYAISKDSVRNTFDLAQALVYAQSLEVANEMGTVTVGDREHGLIKAEIQDVNITITIKPLTKKTVQLTVKGRSDFLMPKVDVAQEVYTKIIERLPL